MLWLILAMFFAFIAAVVFAAVALVRRIRKKAYGTPWTISRICFGACAATLILAASGGQWNMALLLAAILLIICGTCQAIGWTIRKIRKKSTKYSGMKTLIPLGTGFCAAIIAIGGNLTSAMNLCALFFFFAVVVMLFVNAFRAIFKRKTGFLWLSLPACLMTGIVLIITANHIWDHQLEKRASTGEIHEEPIQITYDFEVADGDTPIEIVPSKTIALYDRKTVYVYEEEDLHLALENDFVTADMCVEAIHANEKIEPRFKAFFCDFVERIDTAYPGLNLAILYHNLENLDVRELNSTDYLWESLNPDSLGCYNKRKNRWCIT